MPGCGNAAVLRPDIVATSPVIGGVANVVMEIVIVTAISIVVVAVVAPMTDAVNAFPGRRLTVTGAGRGGLRNTESRDSPSARSVTRLDSPCRITSGVV